MKTKNLFFLIGSVIILFVAAVLFINSPLQSIFAKAGVEQPAVLEELVLVEKPAVQVELAAAAEDAVELPTAELTVIADDVKYFDKEIAKFVLIEDETMLVQQDDCIRTGKEGRANIEFTTDIELNMEPNSEICIVAFRPDEEDAAITKLYIALSIGEAFFTVNTPDKLWDVKMITPSTYIWSEEEAFSYTTTVIFPGTENFTPEEMEEFIDKHPALNPKTVCVREDGSKYFCNGCVTCSLMTESNPVKVIVLCESGIIKVTYLLIPDGLQTIELIAGEQFEYDFPGYDNDAIWRLFCETIGKLADGEEVGDDVIEKLTEPEEPGPGPQPQPTIVVPKPCGDGVCDIYGDENATNCPADCD